MFNLSHEAIKLLTLRRSHICQTHLKPKSNHRYTLLNILLGAYHYEPKTATKLTSQSLQIIVFPKKLLTYIASIFGPFLLL
jgi:hypothetical protein